MTNRACTGVSPHSPVNALYPRSADGAQDNDVPVLDSHYVDDVPQHRRPHISPYLEHRTSLFEHLETLCDERKKKMHQPTQQKKSVRRRKAVRSIVSPTQDSKENDNSSQMYIAHSMASSTRYTMYYETYTTNDGIGWRPQDGTLVVQRTLWCGRIALTSVRVGETPRTIAAVNFL